MLPRYSHGRLADLHGCIPLTRGACFVWHSIDRMNRSDLSMASVGNLIFCLRVKSKTKSVTPDTAFRFNSKDFIFYSHKTMFLLHTSFII
jgi:hypothetical protein